MFNYGPAKCRYCRSEIEQSATGRPRETCAAPVCQREAEAERKRRLRRKKAGLRTSVLMLQPQPKGGRDPLARRVARQLAADLFPHVKVTIDELSALEDAARLGMSKYSLTVTRSGSVRGIPVALPKERRLALQALAKRHIAAVPKPPPRQPRSSDIVGKLPEPFVRRGPRGGSRGTGSIELPLPDRPKLIDW